MGLMLIIFLVFSIIIISVLSIPPVDAELERTDRNLIKAEITLAEKKIVTLNNEITLQKALIIKLEIDIKSKKEAIKVASTLPNTTIEIVKNKEKLATDLITFQKDFADAKIKLQVLITAELAQRNLIILLTVKFSQDSLDKNLIKDEIILAEQKAVSLKAELIEQKKLTVKLESEITSKNKTLKSLSKIPKPTTEIVKNKEKLAAELVILKKDYTQSKIKLQELVTEELAQRNLVILLTDKFAKVMSLPSSVNATTLGVALSKNCLVLLKAHIPTTCPSYDQIMLVFPDNTDQSKLGKFKLIDGTIQRDTPQLKNPQLFYKFDKTERFWVDPPHIVRVSIPMIYIETELPAYKIAGSVHMANYTTPWKQDRYENKTCREIKIGSENWQYMLGDSIIYLKSGCKVTTFDNKFNITTIKSFQDITTSYKWNYDKWIKASMENCKVRGC